MRQFNEVLAELMLENNYSLERLARKIGVKRVTISRWKSGKQTVLLSNAVKLANCFGCSLEYLTGRTNIKLDFKLRDCPPFYDRLKNVMSNRGVTRYRVAKDSAFSESSFDSWSKGSDPLLRTIIDLADYFGLTIDAFIGREK